MVDNASDGGCFHCGLPLPQPPFTTTIANSKREFCCFGCQSVCSAIYQAGLEGFYQRTPEGRLLAPPPEPPKDIELYNLDVLQQEYVRSSGDQRTIHLLVEGIHCAACVWLIERSLHQVDGVLRASVNLSGRRLLLEWDNSRVELATVLKRLATIGYAALPFDPEIAEGATRRQNRAILFRMAFAGFAMMNLTWISIALYSGADAGEYRQLFHWLGFALATPTLFYAGWLFFKGAVTGLLNRHLTMDLPIVIGATTTWLYSSWVTFSGSSSGAVYFDTVVNFIFVILIGRFLEAISKRHAVAATQRLMDLQPRVATVIQADGDSVVPIRTIKTGDQVRVRPGDKIPVDGRILTGRSEVDESMLSGESRPLQKECGDSVAAGTINRGNPLIIETTATLGNTSLGRIIALVEEAQASKAPIQCTADRIVPWFVGITLLLAAITFLFWVQSDFEQALMAATAVLIITCPCAFGMATPMAIAVASGQGARHGILVKNGTVLETLSHINHFIFDKTGTLTRGIMSLQRIISKDDHKTLLTLVAAVEQHSEHAIARAITSTAESHSLPYAAISVSDFHYTPGRGITARVAGELITIGTLDHLTASGIEIDATLTAQLGDGETETVTPVYLARNNRHHAILLLSDTLREEAAGVIASLRQQGIKMTLLSGDRQPVAENIARQLGGMAVIAEVLPAEKDAVIQRLQQQGERVAMVGDGVNDAPALIRADVGIAVGSGTDVSIESADIVLMYSDLNKLPLAAALSRRTLRTIHQNIAISILYNLIMVPLAMAGLITPLVAAISMPVSSLLVIGNAARIRTLFNKRPSCNTTT
ncbi:MAG: heavy metal translocating P-type ATPase [Gammaproteobacteria bacterium]|nr:heavy metal translocating P-type ATPase [Gammaproteobacteria bacterium]